MPEVSLSSLIEVMHLLRLRHEVTTPVNKTTYIEFKSELVNKYLLRRM